VNLGAYPSVNLDFLDSIQLPDLILDLFSVQFLNMAITVVMVIAVYIKFRHFAIHFDARAQEPKIAILQCPGKPWIDRRI
jgi:uncharacterized membrane protein (DUF106 family)